MKFLLSVVALAAAWTAGAQGTTEAILGHSTTPVSTGRISLTAGWTFQPTNFLLVTDLGCLNDVFVSNAGITNIQVGLWAADGALLASNTITSGSLLSAQTQTRYESITPVPIDPGHVYNIGAYSPDGPISFGIGGPGVGAPVSLGEGITLDGTALNTGGFGYPPGVPQTGDLLYLAANFRYQGRVPEPSSGLLLGLGVIFLAARRRNPPR